MAIKNEIANSKKGNCKIELVIEYKEKHFRVKLPETFDTEILTGNVFSEFQQNVKLSIQ